MRKAILVVAVVALGLGRAAVGQADAASGGKAGVAAQGDARPDSGAGALAERMRRERFCNPATVESVHTYYLSSAMLQNDGNEIQTAVRNLLPPDSSRIFFVPSQSALMVCAAPEQQALAARLVHDLDRGRKAFKISYTFTELDGGKRVGTQHYSLMVSDGQRTTVKQGSRVPVATGVAAAAAGESQTQFQYLDVGMNFDVTFTATATGGLLKTKVEQTSVAEERASIAGVQEPVVRQASFEGSPVVVYGRPAMLSSLDMPNSARHMDVEVMVEEVK